MLNFTVGPVMSDDVVCAIGAEQVPYFRTPEFSAVMLENEKLMKKFAKAGDDARVVFITGSGTAAMEATVMNVFDKTDKVLVVNGGSFGQRFVELCQIHEIPYEEIKLEKGKALKKDLFFFRRRRAGCQGLDLCPAFFVLLLGGHDALHLLLILLLADRPVRIDMVRQFFAHQRVYGRLSIQLRPSVRIADQRIGVGLCAA